MANSNKPSSSSRQDVAQSPKKKSPANKSAKKMSPMKTAKIPVKMQKSMKKVALSKKSTTLGSLKKKDKEEVIKKNLAKNTKKSPFKVKAVKNPSGHQQPAPAPTCPHQATVPAHQVGDGNHFKVF